MFNLREKILNLDISKIKSRFLPCFLVMLVVATMVLAPFSVKKVEAEPPVPAVNSAGKTDDGDGMTGGCGLFDFDLERCAATISYTIFFRPTAAVLWFSGQIFNGAVFFSLSGKVLDTDMVSSGWRITRDIANLFFIFIILYIAIATILQLSGYGMKDLLVKVIIIALLVNFSLLVTKVIVDSSNILALEFYNKMAVQGGSVTMMVAGEGAKDISGIFVTGFNPAKMFGTTSFDAWITKTGGDMLIIFVLFIIASVTNLIAAFILFAAGFLFVIRVAVIWLLMILAPLAFLAMALPATSGYAKQWWDKLFKQSFFAPAFLFLFYLVAKIVDEGFLQNIITSADKVAGDFTSLESFFTSLGVVLLHFTVLVVLLVSCLVVAKNMGAYGADTMQKWGQSARKWGQGYAGRVAKRYTAPLAEAAVTGEGKGRITRAAAFVGRGLQKVPFGAKALARAEKWDQPEIKKYEKTYGSYSDTALKNILASPKLNIVNRSQRQAIYNIQKSRMDKKAKEDRRKKILEEGTAPDRIKVLLEEEAEAREAVESKLAATQEAAEKATSKPKEGGEKK